MVRYGTVLVLAYESPIQVSTKNGTRTAYSHSQSAAARAAACKRLQLQIMLYGGLVAAPRFRDIFVACPV